MYRFRCPMFPPRYFLLHTSKGSLASFWIKSTVDVLFLIVIFDNETAKWHIEMWREEVFILIVLKNVFFCFKTRGSANHRWIKKYTSHLCTLTSIGNLVLLFILNFYNTSETLIRRFVLNSIKNNKMQKNDKEKEMKAYFYISKLFRSIIHPNKHYQRQLFGFRVYQMIDFG